MYSTSFIKKILLVATVVLLYSCDKDFNAIGEELIGDNHFDLVPEEYGVVAYNQEVTPVQSNGLPAYSLGIYNNTPFGETTANIVSQVSLADYSGVIGESPEIISAILTVPYFSHTTAADPKGGSVYALDSVYGAKPAVGKLKLSVYESGVQMYDTYFEGGTQLAQLYYTDQNSYFSDNKKENAGKPLNDAADEAQNEKFFFSAAQRTDSTVVDDAAKDKKYTYTYTKPQMRLELNKKFFEDKILKADASKLTSSVAFQQYFRGLYFKVEKSGSSATNIGLLDMATAGTAKITITYKAKTAITTDAAETTETKTLVINVTANSANLLQDVKEPTYQAALTNRNVAGDDRLYLKGGQGSLAVIELKDFGTKLQEIRDKNWLVNEANLVFYIDSDNMKTAEREPKRIYLYDLDNNTIIADYLDGTTNTTDVKLNRSVYGGIIEVDATTKKGTRYKIRITKHIRNIIKDATGTVKNVRLGLAVTEGIEVINTNKLKLKNDVISDAPRGSVMGPLGTILWGGTAAAPSDKRLKLEIYYTKPN